MKKRFSIVFFFLLTTLFVFASVQAAAVPELYKVVGTKDGVLTVEMNFNLIEPGFGKEVAFSLTLPDKKVVVSMKSVEKRGESDYSWVGNVKGQEYSSVVFTVVKGVLAGSVYVGPDSYKIQHADGKYRVFKVDTSLKVPADSKGMVPPTPPVSESLDKQSSTEDGSRIDILVLYTDDFKNEYGSGVEAKIQSFIDEANAAYINSGINTRLTLAHSELYSDAGAAEGVEIGTALRYITGYYDVWPPTPPQDIVTLRNTYKADLVSLLRVYDGIASSCGRGWLMQTVSNSFNVFGYTVVEVKDAPLFGGFYCSDLTLAHEVGHNMGCAHDRDNASNAGAFSYSYGYTVDGILATVMSYGDDEIPYFSSPLVSYQGFPTGVSEGNVDSADNAKTINITKQTVANFYVNDTPVVVEPIVHTLTAPVNLNVSPGGQLGPYYTKVENTSSSSQTFHADVYATNTGTGFTKTLIDDMEFTLSANTSLMPKNGAGEFLNIPTSAPKGTYEYCQELREADGTQISLECFNFNII